VLSFNEQQNNTSTDQDVPPVPGQTFSDEEKQILVLHYMGGMMIQIIFKIF
jgi:hypothetical protein